MKQDFITRPYIVSRRDGLVTYHTTLEEAEDTVKKYLTGIYNGEAYIFCAHVVTGWRNTVEPYAFVDNSDKGNAYAE